MMAQDEPRSEQRAQVRARWALGVVVLLTLAGCTRRYYRNFADSDVYRIERERMSDPRWTVPPRPVEAAPTSRMGDRHDPDHEPIPNDDLGARPFQVTAGRPFEFLGWAKRGTAAVEDLCWLSELPRDADGTVHLDPAGCMRIALANSRDYQTQVENVYLQALSLTFYRFQFFPQLFANQTTQFHHYGATTNDSNQLQLLTQQGLNWSLYSGATLLVNFANSLVFEYNGKGFQTVLSGLTINLTQPLLRGAFARNATQPLSLVERQTLYTIRDFAQYRRTFYVNTVSAYLDLLLQLQRIRNQESNVRSLKSNLDLYEALVTAGLIGPLQRDNIAQQYQSSRLTLLGYEANLQTSLDQYRVGQLGLPADFPLTLDESILKKFELNSPELDDLRKANDALYLSLLQYADPPSRPVMVDAARKVLAEFKQLEAVSGVVRKELTQWRERLAAQKGKVGTGPGPTEADERESYQRQVKLVEELGKNFDESLHSLADNIANTSDFIESIGKNKPEDAFQELRLDMVGRDFRARLAELFVIQTQVRVYLIEVTPVELTVEQAISVGLANRLDLMNSLAQVTDAWRNVEVAGNQLLAGVNLNYTGTLNNNPKKLGIFQFDAHDSLQQAGIQFDLPIVRRSERNTYRTDQILFQRARRAYMLNHDQIVQGIRLDMRNLNLDRRQFEIGREQLLIAARQVDLAEMNTRNPTIAQAADASQSTSLLLLNALNDLLTAKNNLIQNWVGYEIQRMGLYRDFDLMNIDPQGVWTNDSDRPNLNGGPAPSFHDPVGAPVERLLPGPATGGPAADSLSPLPPPPAGARGPFARP